MGKIPLRPKNKFSLKKNWPTIRNTLILLVVLYLISFASTIPSTTLVDFAVMRRIFSGHREKQTDDGTSKENDVNTSQEDDEGDSQGNTVGNSKGKRKGKRKEKYRTASETLDIEAKNQEERRIYVNESRSRFLVENATRDYLRGNYDEALRRLERAIMYDSSNFSAFKLAGQIFFEKNQYRKAFNNWERANELPNEDKTIARDLDVVRKLLRYSRNEINDLRHRVNKQPDDLISKARLIELEERVKE